MPAEKTTKPNEASGGPNWRWLLSPWAIILSVAAGIYLGVYQRGLSMVLAPVGVIYLGLLKMCIIPILLSAITVSLGRMMKSEGARRYIQRMIVVFALTLMFSSLLGVVVGLATSPGKDLGDEAMATLGAFINKSKYVPDLEVALSEPVQMQDGHSGILEFFVRMIPENVFTALSEGINLQVLVFAILFAVALGNLQHHVNEPFFKVLDAIYQSFSSLIRWLMYLLPFGLAVLLANQIAQIGVEILYAMMKFVIVVIASILFLFIASTLIIWRRAGGSLLHTLLAMQETILVALATRSTLATIPSALQAMHNELHFEKGTVDLVVPFGITVCRYGNVLYTAVVAVFVAQLYQVEIGFDIVAVMFLGSILAGMATAGATGVLTLTMLAIVLDPLGLPMEAVLVLFIAIDPIVDPFRTLISVYASCASTALIARQMTPEERLLEESDAIMDRTLEESLDRGGLDGVSPEIKAAYFRKKALREQLRLSGQNGLA